jgi:transposase InsO family protein
MPLRHKTADAIANALYDDVITKVSVPSAILTDQGGEFTGAVMRRLCERLGIGRLRSSAYHPQTDAKCERVHFSVHNLIVKLAKDKLDK